MFAAVEKNSNRAVMIFESGMVSWFKENFPNFDIIEVTNIGTSSFRTDAGTINTVCVITEDFDVYYHIIKTFPETISLDDAYKLIEVKQND